MKRLFSALLATAFVLSISATVSYAAPRDNTRANNNEQKTRQSQPNRKRSDAATQRPATQPRPSAQRPSTTVNQQPHKATAPANRPSSKPSTATNNTAKQRPAPNKSVAAGDSNKVHQPGTNKVASTSNHNSSRRPATAVSNKESVQRPAAPATNNNAAQRPNRNNHNDTKNKGTQTTTDGQSTASSSRPTQRPSVAKPSQSGVSSVQSTTTNNSTTISANPRSSHNSNANGKRYIRPSTPREGRPAPRPTHNQQSNYRPSKITNNTVLVSHPPRIGAHTRPSKYYSSHSGYVRRGNYIVYNNYIVVRPGYISYVYHPLVYYRPLPVYYNPHYYYRYHNYYHGYSDFYILGRLLLAFANAIERNNQQEQIDRLRDDISYLQRKLELQDEQLTTNNKEEFYQLLDELGVSRDEVDNYDLERDYLLYGGS